MACDWSFERVTDCVYILVLTKNVTNLSVAEKTGLLKHNNRVLEPFCTTAILLRYRNVALNG